MLKILTVIASIVFLFCGCKHANNDAEKMFTFLGDDESPKILSAVPGMGDKGLPRNQKIAILFDKPMNINTCVQSFSISPSTQGFYELNDYSMTFTPSTQWSYGTYSYTLTKNCETKKGKDLHDVFTVSFTVGEASTAGNFPEITTVDVSAGTLPECNAGNTPTRNILTGSVTTACMGAPTTNTLSFVFSRPMDRAATASAIAFSPPFAASFVWRSDTNLTIVPDVAFPALARFTLAVSTQAQDLQGIRLQIPLSTSFLVGTTNLLPSITSISLFSDTLAACLAGTLLIGDIVTATVSTGCLGNPATNPMVFVFTRPMNQVQTQASISISPSLTGTYVWSNASQTLTFTPDARLNYGTRYTITIGASAQAQDRIFVASSSVYSFTAGGPLTNAPSVQAVGVASQVGCSNVLPGVGNAAGGNWLLGSCYWDNTLAVLTPSSYTFRAGDAGTGILGSILSCGDVNTDNFKLIFSNFMDLNSTINGVRLRRLSPPSTVVQLASWTWADCQAAFPFGCRVLTLAFSELEASCNATTAFGNAATSGDFNLLQSNNTPAGFPYYILTVDTSARDVNNLPLNTNFNFTMEAK